MNLPTGTKLPLPSLVADCWTPAAGYIYLNSVQELTKALAIIRRTGTKFAVRTTGYNSNIGFSGTSDTAIVLNIKQLKSKELLADQNIAQLRSGNTRDKIYTWLEEQGLSAIGCREPQVETG